MKVRGGVENPAEDKDEDKDKDGDEDEDEDVVLAGVEVLAEVEIGPNSEIKVG